MDGRGRTAVVCGLLIVACASGQGDGRESETDVQPGTSSGATTIGATAAPTSSSTSGLATTMGDESTTIAATTGPAECGNGVVEGAEQCDDGLANADEAACTSMCRDAECGDGLVFLDEEDCDDGNDDDTDECTVLCAAPACDDGIVSGDESDVDCGGGCDPCVAGESCNDDGDCLNQACTQGLCAPAASCADLLAGHPTLDTGPYTIDPNGGSIGDAVEVFCDMEVDGGGWTALAANGDNSVAETTEPSDCYPLLTADADEGCGESANLLEDFAVDGAQQGALQWRYLMAIAYGDGGYGDKLAFFAIDFGSAQATSDERFNGTRYIPTGVTTIHGEMACTGGNIVHYCRAGTYNPQPTYIGNGTGTVFGHNTTTTMNDVARMSFGFTDAVEAGATASGSGVDDYQDGWSCGDLWGPQEIRGERMVVFVR